MVVAVIKHESCISLLKITLRLRAVSEGTMVSGGNKMGDGMVVGSGGRR